MSAVRIGFSIDPRQELAEADELRLVELGARLGYDSAWTPSGPDRSAFDRCLRWHAASGLPTGISVEIDPKQTHLTISGIDRQKVGQIAADMRSLRKPDPYKNKGVRYAGEKLKKKVGKTGAK